LVRENDVLLRVESQNGSLRLLERSQDEAARSERTRHEKRLVGNANGLW
jgi:hypothetical protein